MFCRIEGGELFDRLVEEEFLLTEAAIVIIMRQVCEGMAYIHSQNVVHLDMKVSVSKMFRTVQCHIFAVSFSMLRLLEKLVNSPLAGRKNKLANGAIYELLQCEFFREDFSII